MSLHSLSWVCVGGGGPLPMGERARRETQVELELRGAKASGAGRGRTRQAAVPGVGLAETGPAFFVPVGAPGEQPPPAPEWVVKGLPGLVFLVGCRPPWDTPWQVAVPPLPTC